jgi:hypothetical protein
MKTVRKEQEDILREYTKLREELQEKDKKIKTLESRNMEDCEHYSPKQLYNAVIKHGCHQWYSLCVEMGFPGDTVMATTTGIGSHADKIRALFDKKINDVGEGDAKKALLQACSCIPNPIIGGVMESLSKFEK